MVSYTIYDGPTGRILRSGEAQETTLGMQLQSEDEVIAFGAYNPETTYFKNGQATPRPAMDEPTIEDFGLSLSSPPPEGTRIKASAQFTEFEGALESDSVAFPMPEDLIVEIEPPFPWIGGSVEFKPAGGVPPEGALVVSPNIDAMRDYFSKALYAKGEELVDAMLGNPSETTRRRWLIKRTVYDRSLAGTLTPGDMAALEAGVKYSGQSTEDELAEIGSRVAFENWVTFRSDGLRSEAEKRVLEAQGPSEILAAIAWAETESVSAVAEAMSMR